MLKDEIMFNVSVDFYPNDLHSAEWLQVRPAESRPVNLNCESHIFDIL